MKSLLSSALGLLPALAGGGLVPGDPGGPVLSTPGTATWDTEVIDTGIRATYTLTGDTILDWGQLEVGAGDELIFDFVGGTGSGSVSNMLGGGTFHAINGSVFSNGNVGFFSSGSNLMINGSITAASVTLATLGADAGDLLDGGDLTLTGSGLNFLSINGNVTATDGDVNLAGGFINIDDSATITASGQLAVAGFSQQTVLKAGGGFDSEQSAGMGFVLNLGEGNGSSIEIKAGTEINNGGRFQAGTAGNGRIFLEVGSDGQVTNDGTGIMVGAVEVSGAFNNGGSVFRPNSDNAANAVNSSALKIPALHRPDGSRASSSQVVQNNAPMMASADANRDRRQVTASRKTSGNSLMKRASFFGMRGGKVRSKEQR